MTTNQRNLGYVLSLAFLFVVCGFLVTIFSGCGVPLPEGDSEAKVVSYRLGQNNKTTEVIIRVHSEFAWRTFGPEPGPTYGYRTETKYYFSDRHVRRKPLPFLEPLKNGWEVFAPVEGTNYWIRVQGQSRLGRTTNELAVTVFSPQKQIYKVSIETADFPKTNFLHFADGNRAITYKSDHDTFKYSVYSVLQNGSSNGTSH